MKQESGLARLTKLEASHFNGELITVKAFQDLNDFLDQRLF